MRQDGEVGRYRSPGFLEGIQDPCIYVCSARVVVANENVNESLEYIYIQHVANYALGASIISYGHFLFHATWINRKKEPDLPFWAQALAMTVHVVWFIFFLWTIFLSTR